MSKARLFVSLLTLGLGCGLADRTLAQPVGGLEVQAFPEHVLPLAPDGERRWSGRISVSITPAATNVPIQLRADWPAILSTPYVEVRSGARSAYVEVTAARKGSARVYAFTEESGHYVTANISFDLPATRLRVSVEPPQSLSVGSAGAVLVHVSLLDEDGSLTMADRDTDLAVSLPLGRLDHGLTIPAGQFSTSALLSSLRPGGGSVIAEAPGLERGEDAVEFAFPWGILAVAMLGGAFGAAYQSGLRQGRRLLVAALPGLGFSLAAYGLVAFLPANALPAVLKPFAALPVINALGAVVLGLAAGYGGRRCLPVGSSTPEPEATRSPSPLPGLSQS